MYFKDGFKMVYDLSVVIFIIGKIVICSIFFLNIVYKFGKIMVFEISLKLLSVIFGNECEW